MLTLKRCIHIMAPMRGKYHNPKISSTVAKRFKKHMDTMVVGDIKRQEKEAARKGPQTVPKHPILYDSNRTRVFNRKFLESLGMVMVDMPELLGKGLTITKVNVRQDFSEVRVFWVSRDSEQEVAELLNSCSKKIRKAMFETSGLGQLPRIVFLVDNAYQLSVDMDRLFTKLDLGPDNNTEDSVWNKALELELGCNAGGVERDEILSRVEMSIMKSKAVHRDMYREEQFKAVYRDFIERNGAAHKLEVKQNIKKFLVNRRKTVQQKAKLDENGLHGG